jgi:hypothetical protein
VRGDSRQKSPNKEEKRASRCPIYMQFAALVAVNLPIRRLQSLRNRFTAEELAPIKNPDGFNRNVAFCIHHTCGYSAPARGCDAPGSTKSTTKEAILDGRKKYH